MTILNFGNLDFKIFNRTWEGNAKEYHCHGFSLYVVNGHFAIKTSFFLRVNFWKLFREVVWLFRENFGSDYLTEFFLCSKNKDSNFQEAHPLDKVLLCQRKSSSWTSSLQHIHNAQKDINLCMCSSLSQQIKLRQLFGAGKVWDHPRMKSQHCVMLYRTA